MTKFSSPLPVVRPALPRDIADMVEFTKFIWGGHDYVGYVFAEWLKDPRGQLLAAEYAGKCIGCAKVSFLAPGQWWLEGFRVDPNHQGLKIGSKLDASANEWFDEHADGTLRLLTNSKRVQVHHLSESRGFVRVGEVCAYAAEPLNESTDAFMPIRAEEAEEAAALVRRLYPDGYLNIGWKFAAPNADAIRAAMQDENLFFWWRGRAGIVSAWEDDEDGLARLIVGMDACAGGKRVQLLEDLRRLASACGAGVARWMNVIDEEVVRDLEAAGYRKDWEDNAYLYERRHP